LFILEVCRCAFSKSWFNSVNAVFDESFCYATDVVAMFSEYYTLLPLTV